VNSPALTEVDLQNVLGAVRRIARSAGEAIMEVYRRLEQSGAVAVDRKADASPLTEADLAAHRLIVEGLRALTPEWPVLSEEAADVPLEARRSWSRFWLVDPLDGTKEFLSRNGEFTVNIALIENHRPVLGVVHVPVSGVDYFGFANFGAWKAARLDEAGTRIRVAPSSRAPIRVVGSRSHASARLNAALQALDSHELVSMGSSLKFCVLAEGAADVYPRIGPTSEWDTAAAHAIVQGAGGDVLRLDGSPLEYNRGNDWLNPNFIAIGPRDQDWVRLFSGVS
jgi:3'(2'), 5'-bisphosphate nucleotidase